MFWETFFCTCIISSWMEKSTETGGFYYLMKKTKILGQSSEKTWLRFIWIVWLYLERFSTILGGWNCVWGIKTKAISVQFQLIFLLELSLTKLKWCKIHWNSINMEKLRFCWNTLKTTWFSLLKFPMNLDITKMATKVAKGYALWKYSSLVTPVSM